MKHAKIARKAYLIPLLALVLLGSNLAGQSIRFQARLNDVAYNYDNNDYYGPDIRWKWSGTVSVGGITEALTGGNYSIEDGDYGLHTFTINRTLIDKSVSLPASGNTSLNLCDDIIFTIKLESWEEDSGGETSFDSGDDDRYQATYTYSISSAESGVWEQGTGQGNGTYGFQFQFRYDLVDPITQLSVTDDDGGPITDDLCADSRVRLTALRPAGISGGNFAFSRKLKNTEDWEIAGLSITQNNYLSIAAEDLEIYDYRVNTPAGIHCLGGSTLWKELPPFDGTIFPSFSNSIPYETIASCENSNTGMVIYTGRNLGDGLFINLSLRRRDGGKFLSVGESRRILATQRDTFRNLNGGRYQLFATVDPSDPAVNLVDDCTSIEEFTLPESFGPELLDASVVAPTCTFPLGNLRATINRKSSLKHTFLLYRASEPNIVFAQSELTVLRDHTFENLLPGDYLLEVPDERGCSFVTEPVTIPEQPGLASWDVEIHPFSDEFDIGCTGGSTQATVSIPEGEGDYLIEVGGQAFTLLDGGSPVEITINRSSIVSSTRLNTGCVTALFVNPTENPTPINLEITDVVGLTACTPMGGSFVATITNGVPPYTFSLVDGESVTQDENTYVFDELISGNFRVEIEDSRGCMAGRFTSIQAVNGLQLFSTTTPITCIGATDGSVRLEAFQGNGPYQYKIDDGAYQDAPEFMDLAPGNYAATVRDADGCETTAAFLINGRDEITIISAFSAMSQCHGDTTKPANPLNIMVEGRLVGNCSSRSQSIPSVEEMFEVSFDGGVTFRPVTEGEHLGDGCSSKSANLQFTGILPGDYDLQVRDLNGCLSAIFSITEEAFPQPDPMVVTITEIRNASCFGVDDGSITVNIEGGTIPFELVLFEYHDTSPDTGHRRRDLTVVRERFTENRNYTFVNLPASTYLPNEPHGPEGPGGYKLVVGSLNDQPPLEFRPFDFSYEPPGCYAEAPNPTDPSRPIEIFEPDTLIAEEVLLDPASDIQCDGSGAIVTINQVSGGTPPYEYSTTGEAYDPSNILFPTTAGEPLFIKDANQCVTIVPFPEFTLPTSPIDVEIAVLSLPSSCTESSVRFTPSGGRPPYSISVVPFAGQVYSATSEEGESVVINNINNDFYFVTVQDSFTCRRSIEFNLERGPELNANTTEVIDESCLDQADGSLTIEVTSGNPPYQISYNGIVTIGATRTVTGLSAGAHTFVIIDAKNCAIAYEAFVNLATELDLLVTTTSPTPCADSENGSMVVTPTGGTPPYQLEWLFDPSLNTSLAEGESATFTDLASIEEEYAMRVTDASGCSQRIDRFLDWADPIEASFFNFNPNCVNLGAINLQISNGTPPYQVSINGAPPVTETFFNELPAGEYNFTVTDANGCRYERELSTTLTQETLIELRDPFVSFSVCYEPTGFIEVVGPNLQTATFSLNGGPPQSSPSFENLGAGIYTVEVVQGSCTQTLENIQIFGPPPINLVQTRTENPCTGDVDISLVGESSGDLLDYTINGESYIPGTVVRFLPGNSYEVAITDLLSCVYTEIIEIPAFTPLAITGEELIDAACEDGTGQAAVTVIGGTPPYSFAWSNGGPADSLFLGANAGAYQVTVSDANDCTVVSEELTINLIGNGRPVISLQEIQDANCEEGIGSITVSVSSGIAPYTYTWSHDANLNAPIAEQLNSGNYDLTVTDAAGCDATLENLEVEFIAPPILSLDFVRPSCGLSNGSIRAITVGGQPPYTYRWSHDPDLTGDFYDNYSGAPLGTIDIIRVWVTDANGCLSSGGVSLPSELPLTLEVLGNEPSTCGEANGRLAIGISGEPSATTTVSWAHDPDLTDTNLDNLLSGTYFLTVSDDRGCSTTGEYIVANSDGPALETATVVNAQCEDGTGSLSLTVNEGTPPYRFNWEHDPALTSNTAENLTAGTYRVTVTDGNDCTLNLVEEVAFIAPPAVTLIPTLPSCEDVNSGSVASEIMGGTSPFTYAWSNGSNQANLENVPAGNYTLTVTDALGCTTTQTANVGPRVPPVITSFPLLKPAVMRHKCLPLIRFLPLCWKRWTTSHLPVSAKRMVPQQ